MYNYNCVIGFAPTVEQQRSMMRVCSNLSGVLRNSGHPPVRGLRPHRQKRCRRLPQGLREVRPLRHQVPRQRRQLQQQPLRQDRESRGDG